MLELMMMGRGQVATQLAITTQPAQTGSGCTAFTPQPFAITDAAALSTVPVVEVRDANGVLMSSSTALVTVTITSGTGGAILAVSSVNAVAGVATFTGMKLGTLGGDYVLTFASSGLTSAVSSSFNISDITTYKANVNVRTMYDYRYGKTVAAGLVTAWAEASGGALPGMTGNGTVNPADDGTYIVTSGSNGLNTATDSLFDLTAGASQVGTGPTLLYGGSVQTAGNVYAVGVSNAGFAQYHSISGLGAGSKISTNVANTPIAVSTTPRRTWVHKGTGVGGTWGGTGPGAVGKVQPFYYNRNPGAITGTSCRLDLGGMQAAIRMATKCRYIVWIGHSITSTELVYHAAWEAAFHPQITVATGNTRSVRFIGNSNTNGFGVTAGQEWPAILLGQTGLTTNIDSDNFGENGKTGARILADCSYVSTPAALMGTYGTKNAWFVMEGINDLNGGATAATTYANLKGTCDMLRDVCGVPANMIFLATCTAAGSWNAATLTQWANFKTLVRAQTDYPVFDAAAILTDCTNETYMQADHLHYNSTGHSMLVTDATYGALKLLNDRSF